MALLDKLQPAQPIIITLITAIFLMHLVASKDELQQQSFSRALRSAVLISVTTAVGYIFYALLNNILTIKIYSVMLFVEATCIITIIFYYLDLANIGFSFRLRNKTIANVMMYISIVISVVSTASIVLELNFFANPVGLVRYDELILFANVILVSLIIMVLPKRKSLSHKVFYKQQQHLNKSFNLIALIFVVVFALLVTTMIVKKFM